MAPNQSFVLSSVSLEPVSRTYQYRKVMKPMLERKRRARINRCLDELKELMAGALQSEGENVAKLEKADILELTVRHLHNLREKKTLFLRQDQLNSDRFWEGFRHCASEVTQFLAKFDQKMGAELLSHITGCVQSQQLSKTQVTLPRPDIFLINPYRYEDLLIQNSSSNMRLDINYIRDPSGNIDDIIRESTVWRPW